MLKISNLKDKFVINHDSETTVIPLSIMTVKLLLFRFQI